MQVENVLNLVSAAKLVIISLVYKRVDLVHGIWRDINLLKQGWRFYIDLELYLSLFSQKYLFKI